MRLYVKDGKWFPMAIGNNGNARSFITKKHRNEIRNNHACLAEQMKLYPIIGWSDQTILFHVR